MRRKEKKRFTRFIVPLFIIAIFVGSIFGVIIGGTSPQQDVTEFNDFLFRETTSNTYSFTVNQLSYIVRNKPDIIRQVAPDIPSSLPSDLQGAQKIYLIHDDPSSSNTLYIDFFRNFRQHTTVTPACLPEDADQALCADIPLKTCADAGQGVLVFISSFHEEEKQITYEQGCLHLKGSQYYLQTLLEALLFTYLGVI